MSPYVILQPSGVDQNTVGQRQDVICSISVPPDVNPDNIELGWLNEDDIITNDSRVTIVKALNYLMNHSDNFSSNIISAILQFDPLIEDDEGTYNCYSIVNETESFTSIRLQNLKSMYVSLSMLAST